MQPRDLIARACAALTLALAFASFAPSAANAQPTGSAAPPGAFAGAVGVPPAAGGALVPASDGPPAVVALGDAGLTGEKLMFLLLALVIGVLALGVILFRNPINGAVALIFVFFSLAGVYVLASAHFVAVIQVLVYAGAVMVLFIFVIMLLNLSDRELGVAKGKLLKALGLLALGVLGILTYFGLTSLPEAPLNALAETPPGFGTVKSVGTNLFTHWLLPFEIIGVLLLVAVVGAVTISRRGYQPKKDARSGEGGST